MKYISKNTLTKLLSGDRHLIVLENSILNNEFLIDNGFIFKSTITYNKDYNEEYFIIRISRKEFYYPTSRTKINDKKYILID